jgi:alpha-1,3/alpha-1,6-mannosyltransferase
MILSLNRFERKKNIKLALETVAYLKSIDPQVVQNIILVIAGGYDPRVKENVEHFQVVSFKDRCSSNPC